VPVRVDDYGAYLWSEHWQRVRREAHERAGHRCESCGSPPFAVHHLTYLRLGCERPEDVRVVCRSCHLRYHDGLNGDVVRVVILDALAGGPLATNRIAKATGRQRNVIRGTLTKMVAEGLVEPVGVTGAWAVVVRARATSH
jgi:hypothetical protein